MIRFSSLPLFAAVLLAGCQPTPPVPGALASPGTSVLVTVNGSNITQEMIDAQVKQLPEQVRAQLERSGGASRIKDNLVAQELLYQEAVKAKLYDQPDMVIPMALAQRQILAQAVLKQEVEKRLTDARLQQWYQDHLVQFAKPQVNAAHIIVADEKEANELAAKAKGGADFAELAKASSKDKATANDGGKLGWLGQRDVREPLGSALFSAAKGDIVGPIQTPGGWHIVKIEDKRDQVPFEEVKDTIRTQAEREVQGEYIEELKKSAKVEEKGGETEPGGAPAGAAPGMPAGHPPMSTGAPGMGAPTMPQGAAGAAPGGINVKKMAPPAAPSGTGG